MRKLKKRILIVLAFIVLLPYGLSVIYAFLPSPSTLMLADWLRLRSVKREWIALEEISPFLAQAVITAEDSAFCEHFGFDFRQIEKSLEKAQATKKPVRATSTITQQLAKNLFLWHGRSWLRKILETPIAFWLELIWTKRRILEVYLNIVEWGDGIYGAEEAARFHFKIPSSRLSAFQSALLAASLPNPERRIASRPNTRQIDFAANLVARMQHSSPDLSCIK